MSSNVINRETVRDQFAALLATALVGSGKPAVASYNFLIGDFKGKSPVIVVTSTGTGRGSSLNFGTTEFLLEVHNFVLYALKPVAASNNPTSGNNKVINISDTSVFTVGDTVLVEDDYELEIATITAVAVNTSITVASLVYNYTTPSVSVWAEPHSEDRLDLLEKGVADVVVAANDSGTWESVEYNGQSEIDGVELGGGEYRHEVIPIRVTVQDN